MAIKPWSENIWFSPCYVINELRRAIQTQDKVIIKRTKEAWICAVALICHTKMKPAEWWIQIPNIDPPDVIAMNLVPTADGLGQNMSILKVEIFEISQHDDESIEKSIERKLGNSDYSGMTLIAFVRRMTFFEHEKVSDYIKKLKPKAFCIFLILSEENNTNFSLIQIFPECVKLKHDFGLFCKTTDQRDFIELTRGMRTKRDDNVSSDRLTLIP